VSEEDIHVVHSISYQEKLDAAAVEEFAPRLVGNYRRTSDPTINYNCLAWAVENNEKWFDPQPFCAGYFWPKGVPREWNMVNTLRVLEVYGYTEQVENGDLTEGMIKIAVYEDDDGTPTHFARQLANGHWTSKAGELIDFEHDNLECLECEDYGKVSRFVAKRVDCPNRLGPLTSQA